jgi:hypothetical protein
MVDDQDSGRMESDETEVDGKKPRKVEDFEARRARLEKEANALQSSLKDGVMSDLKTKVAWVLNQFSNTRNSDVALTLKYWELFQSNVYNSSSMSPRDLFRLERFTSIARVRAKIQNEYNLFPADPSISRRRRANEEEVKEAVVDDKPDRNIIFVFADETGKTAEYVCVAAVWVLTGYTLFKLSQAIQTWQVTSPWAKTEIHFSEFRRHQVEALKDYLTLIKKHREFLSFKVIAVERSTIKRSIEEIVQRLHEFMLVRGASHEVKSNRIRLPHEIRLTVDAEQSLDVIACSDIKNRIADAYKTLFEDELQIGDVSAVSSHASQMVQLADVIAGAVNRRRNHHGERGFKDDMADMIITELDIQLEKDDIPGVDATTWLHV